MPYKKRYTKKSKLQTQLSRLIYQNKIMNKLSKVNTSSLYFGVREVNPVDNIGRVELSNRTTLVSGANRLPLIILPLLNISNGGNAGQGILRLKQGGYDFEEVVPITFLGAKGQIHSASHTSFDVKRLLCRFLDVRLLLRQHQKKDAKFKVYLMKILHDDLVPILTETDVNKQKMKQLLYYNHFLRQQIANPILENMENLTTGIKGKFKIMWEKEYHLNEQHGDLEEAHYQEVKIFKKLDRMLRYEEEPEANIDNTEDPDTPVFDNVQVTPTNQPDYRANIFLVITANTSLSDADSASLYDVMTLDIATKVKYTAPQGNVIE